MCSIRQVELIIEKSLPAVKGESSWLSFHFLKPIADSPISALSMNISQLTFFLALFLPKLTLHSPFYSPDLTFCSTCFLCLGTYLPIKFPSTLHEWMPFSVMWVHRSPDGRGGKQPWQFLDVILIDFEWWSLTEETPYGTTPSQKPEHWRCLLIEKGLSPDSGFMMSGQKAQGGLLSELIPWHSHFPMAASL